MAIVRRILNAGSLKAKDAARPNTYQRKILRKEQFSYSGDVHITGDVHIKERLIVGGNLRVDGSLFAGDIYCVGRISVGGAVTGGECYVGVSIDAGGHIHVSSLETGLDAQYICDLLEFEDGSPDDEDIEAVDKLVHPEIAVEMAFDREEGWMQGEPTVSAGGSFQCYVLRSDGDVAVEGSFDCDDAHIGGQFRAGNIYMTDDLTVYGCVHCRLDIVCDDLFVGGDVLCDGNLECGTVESDGGSISALGHILVLGDLIALNGNIQAGKSIAALGAIKSGKYVKAGEFVFSDSEISTAADYGIFAGLCLPRSKWAECGYIAASTKPQNILAGKFMPDETWELATAALSRSDDAQLASKIAADRTVE